MSLTVENNIVVTDHNAINTLNTPGVTLAGVTLKSSRIVQNATWLTGTALNASATLTLAQSGPILYTIAASNLTATLPATIVGICYRIVVVAAGGGTLSVAPNSADYIAGLGLNSGPTDNKAYILAAPVVGDYIQIVADGANGWFVSEASGVWTRAA